MKKKIKIYKLAISKEFPKTHPRVGEPTYFEQKIRNNFAPAPEKYEWCKLHTCRADYELWKKRIDEVKAGNAILVPFNWSGKPYEKGTNHNNLFVFYNGENEDVKNFVNELLNNDSRYFYSELINFANNEIGVQKLEFSSGNFNCQTVDGNYCYSEISKIANNDGLSFEYFRDWFKDYDLSKPMAIIHFTNFRY